MPVKFCPLLITAVVTEAVFGVRVTVVVVVDDEPELVSVTFVIVEPLPADPVIPVSVAGANARNCGSVFPR